MATLSEADARQVPLCTRFPNFGASSGMSDVIHIYNRTQRDGIAFNLAYTGSDFSELPAPFDPAHMRALFEYGYDRGRRGYNWAKAPQSRR